MQVSGTKPAPPPHVTVQEVVDGKMQTMMQGTIVWLCGYAGCSAPSSKCAVNTPPEPIAVGERRYYSWEVNRYSTKEKAEEVYLKRLLNHVRSSGGDVLHVKGFHKKFDLVKHLPGARDVKNKFDEILKRKNELDELLKEVK